MPPARNAKRKSAALLEDAYPDNDESHGDICMSFTQQAPEMSQGILPIKAAEQQNLERMKPEEREKALMDLTRLILFRALAGEPIDRLKCCKDAGIGPNQGKISSAAFAEAAERLKNVFGFAVKRFPKWMEDYKSIPVKFKDRYYVTLTNVDDISGNHSKAIYSVHPHASIEKGFLMVVLALVFCKGEIHSDGSRWILDADLYRLLNILDENIPGEPPLPGSKKKNGKRNQGGNAGVALTPDVDELLEKYVRRDYLLREKISEEQLKDLPQAEEHNLLYALGPRAAVEIGRKQIIYFCAEILDEEPDPNMLMELEQDEEAQEEEFMEEVGE